MLTQNEKIELLSVCKGNLDVAMLAEDWLTKLPPVKARRRIQVMSADGEWLDAQGDDLIAGQVIRMFEPDGAPVDFGNGVHQALLDYAEPINANGRVPFIFIVRPVDKLVP